ncbi:hypothetical protein ACTFIZ_002978, partial [Dictyostelium cf. discoideum]
RISNNRYK